VDEFKLNTLGTDVTLIQDDYMVPTINSYHIQQKVPNGQLVVYPNSGHGFLFQYPDLFAQHVITFLEQ
jgi:pimeloyl-ACP methyl ester carboxylesterase